MTPFLFAWRSLTRQPARAVLGIAGIAVVGALLFDMLLLSRGLVESLKMLMDDGGYDVRITNTDALPGNGLPVEDLRRTLDQMRELPQVEALFALRFGSAEATAGDKTEFRVALLGVDGPPRGTWTLVEGDGLDAPAADGPAGVLVNRTLAERLGLSPGMALELRGSCGSPMALPAVPFRVAGIADLRFDSQGSSVVARSEDYYRICSNEPRDAADLVLAASRPGSDPEALAAAMGSLRPDLRAYSNAQLVTRLQMREFSYYRQMSFVLSTMTLFFAFLLIATLLTVSVNQRLGEVATLRALGFPRRRVVADLLWESALLVGAGGLLGFPLGDLLARQLDSILRSVPGVPQKVEFFYFQPRVVWLYVALLATTGVLAAAYPVFLAARLPIAATLRREVT